MGSGSRSHQRKVMNEYAKLLQRDYNQYLQNGAVAEDEILDIASGNEKEFAANRAMALSDQAFDNAALASNQQLSRYGIQLNNRQRQGKGREYAMAKILSRVNAANNTRIAEGERQSQARDMAMNLGGALYSSSLGKMGYAAEGAAADIALQAQQKAQRRANNMQLASTAIGTGAMLFMASDEKLKDGIKENDNPASLKKIMAMRMKKYRYKEDTGQPDGERTGVMEHEAPDSIRAESNGTKGVDVGNWVGELTGAVQELGRQVEQTRAGLKKLKGRVAA